MKMHTSATAEALSAGAALVCIFWAVQAKAHTTTTHGILTT